VFFECFLIFFVEKLRKHAVLLVFVLPGLIFIGFLNVFSVFVEKLRKPSKNKKNTKPGSTKTKKT